MAIGKSTHRMSSATIVHMKKGPTPKPVGDRIEGKFERGPGCWEWTGKRNSQGYGLIRLDRSTGQMAMAHRVSYEVYVGSISDGLIVRHDCDNPPCVNPAHLRLGTRQDNIEDMVRRRRHHMHSRTTCRRGHLYDEVNLYIDPRTGQRHCKECRRISRRARLGRAT